MEKKPYEPPEVIVHGTVTEITLGLGNGNEDVPCGDPGLNGGNPGDKIPGTCFLS